MLKLIVDSVGVEDINKQNELGRTPLHEVVAIGDEKMLKLMWKLKADANIMDNVCVLYLNFYVRI